MTRIRIRMNTSAGALVGYNCDAVTDGGTWERAHLLKTAKNLTFRSDLFLKGNNLKSLFTYTAFLCILPRKEAAWLCTENGGRLRVGGHPNDVATPQRTQNPQPPSPTFKNRLKSIMWFRWWTPQQICRVLQWMQLPILPVPPPHLVCSSVQPFVG